MPSRATGLLLLSLLSGGLGCGITKPADLGTGNPEGGAPGAGSTPGNLGGGEAGHGSLGSGGNGGTASGDGSGGHPGIAGSGGTLVGSGGDGTGTGNTSATGGTTSNGSGGVRGSGGAPGTGTASGGSATGGGNPSASGGTNTSATGGAIGTGGATDPPGTGGADSGGTGGASESDVVAIGMVCDAATMIPTDVSDTIVDVINAGPTNIDVPCATATGAFAFTFILTQPELVYADTFDLQDTDTVLAFSDQCDGSWTTLPASGTAACNDDACGTHQSQAVALLGYGQHYLFVGGAHGRGGQTRIHFQHAQIGSGALTQLASGASTVLGTTHGPGAVSLCQAAGGEDSYWWQSCPSYAGGAITATTCAGTSYDTVLSLQIPSTGAVTCADDDIACGVQSSLSSTVPSGAGIYVLTVDGTAGSDNGSYTLTTHRP